MQWYRNLSLPAVPLPSRGIYTSLDKSPADQPRQRGWWNHGGYRRLVAAGTVLAAAVLIVNIVALSVALTRPTSTLGTKVLYQGDCGQTARTSTVLHFVINALGTLLLAASNASMQCLTAPTRRDIDAAHARGQWLHIGVGSIKNFSYIGRWRQAAWLVLALSSIPLHLLYNAVIIQTSEATSYTAVVAAQDFLGGAPISLANTGDPNVTSPGQIQEEAHTYTRLDTSDCVAFYSSPFVSGRTNVVLMTNVSSQATEANTSVLLVSGFVPSIENVPYSVFYGDPQSEIGIDHVINGLISYVPVGGGFKNASVEYCLSKEIPSVCSLQLHPSMLTVVIIANILKIACFLFVLLGLRRMSPLITVGDAVASLFEIPDPNTLGSQALSRTFVEKYSQTIEQIMQKKQRLFRPPRRQPFRDLQHHWQKSVSQRQRAITFFTGFLWMVVGGIFLAFSFSGDGQASLSTLWQNGFGNVYPQDIFFWTLEWNVSANILLANALQIPLSLFYFSYNQFLSEMCASAEIMRFANERKALRVTHPRGKQRSSYWLSIPYRYSIPFLSAGAALHWTASATVFLTELSILSPSGELQANPVNGVGYSPLGLLLTFLIGSTLTVVLMVIGRFKLPRGMPVLGSCSLAISAACHGRNGRQGGAELPLIYGVVEVTGARTAKVGFSNDTVEPLLDRWYYDGRPEEPVETVETVETAPNK